MRFQTDQKKIDEIEESRGAKAIRGEARNRRRRETNRNAKNAPRKPKRPSTAFYGEFWLESRAAKVLSIIAFGSCACSCSGRALRNRPRRRARCSRPAAEVGGYAHHVLVV